MGVGPITLSDVQLAVPMGARILGFNVRTSGADVDSKAKQHGVEVGGTHTLVDSGMIAHAPSQALVLCTIKMQEVANML